MTHDFLSLSPYLAVVVCSNRLTPLFLCLAVLAKAGKTWHPGSLTLQSDLGVVRNVESRKEPGHRPRSQ